MSTPERSSSPPSREMLGNVCVCVCMCSFIPRISYFPRPSITCSGPSVFDTEPDPCGSAGTTGPGVKFCSGPIRNAHLNTICGL